MKDGVCPFHVKTQGAIERPVAVPVDVAASSAGASVAEVGGEKPTLSAQLKARTQAVHDAAEHHAFHSLVMGPQASLNAYAMMLGQMLHVHGVLEPILRVKAQQDGAFTALVGDQYLHLNALIADLEFLGAGAQVLKPVPATRRFGEMIAQHGMQNPAWGLLGIFYVLEGSTNGGTIIAKRLREAHGWEDDRGTAFINPHGNQVRAAWKEWKTALDAIVIDSTSQEQVIQGACDTFRMMMGVLTDLHAEIMREPVSAKA